MKPFLTAAQGRLLRALAFSLSEDGEDRVEMTVEVFTSRPWASLTFTGERHHLVVQLPGAITGRIIDAERLSSPRSIVAVEATGWEVLGGACRLTIDLLTIDTGEIC